MVRDADGPVSGAVVRIQATDIVSRSGPDGAFELPKRPRGATITAWAPGYLVGWTESKREHADIVIELKPHYTTDSADYDWLADGGERGSQTCGHSMPRLHDRGRRRPRP